MRDSRELTDDRTEFICVEIRYYLIEGYMLKDAYQKVLKTWKKTAPKKYGTMKVGGIRCAWRRGSENDPRFTPYLHKNSIKEKRESRNDKIEKVMRQVRLTTKSNEQAAKHIRKNWDRLIGTKYPLHYKRIMHVISRRQGWKDFMEREQSFAEDTRQKRNEDIRKALSVLVNKGRTLNSAMTLINKNWIHFKLTGKKLSPRQLERIWKENER